MEISWPTMTNSMQKLPKKNSEGLNFLENLTEKENMYILISFIGNVYIYKFVLENSENRTEHLTSGVKSVRYFISYHYLDENPVCAPVQGTIYERSKAFILMVSALTSREAR